MPFYLVHSCMTQFYNAAPNSDFGLKPTYVVFPLSSNLKCIKANDNIINVLLKLYCY